MIEYKDIAVFATVETTGYRGEKVLVEQAEVEVVFLQNTSMINQNYQETYDADAICYVNPLNQFIIDNSNRLEGMHVLMQLYGRDRDTSFFKVVSVTVNRDHLLGNKIDNIQCFLKKTEPVGGVS